jgi:beta-carotene 15,15'-dioxygenase
MRLALSVHLLWFLPALLALAWLERQWPLLAIGFFVGATLTLGFAHGAMDIFLLRDQHGRFAVKACLAYALGAALLAMILAPWPGVALIVLILLSVWHFGEQAHFEHANQPQAGLLRAVQGGGSVMLPVLLSPYALVPWVQSIALADALWAWPVWVGMAGLWCALLLAALVLFKPWRAGEGKTLWIELIVLVILNLLLSPLLAFALFFGLYHSGVHIWRMLRLLGSEGSAWQGKWWAATLAITWLALALLFWWMPAQEFQHRDTGSWLRWLVVALAAVTLPHLVLVSRASKRLFLSTAFSRT